ncbi:MAG: hypothetical protein RL069_2285 [Planctomycetota bacterium]|jgi:hypothetical protein
MGSRSREFQVFKVLLESQSEAIYERDGCLTILTIFPFLTVFEFYFRGALGKIFLHSGMRSFHVGIFFELFLFLARSPDEVFLFI